MQAVKRVRLHIRTCTQKLSDHGITYHVSAHFDMRACACRSNAQTHHATRAYPQTSSIHAGISGAYVGIVTPQALHRVALAHADAFAQAISGNPVGLPRALTFNDYAWALDIRLSSVSDTITQRSSVSDTITQRSSVSDTITQRSSVSDTMHLHARDKADIIYEEKCASPEGHMQV
jgi:hypothetical protein